jgi:hypothetical protein
MQPVSYAMTNGQRLGSNLVAITIGLVALSGATVCGQNRNDAVPRTLWGAPDLHGVWTGSSLTPLERPREFEGRQFLTAEETAAIEARAADGQVDASPQPGDPGTYNLFWYDRGTKVIPGGRTSLIVDPSDGQLPFTDAGRERNLVSSAHYGVGARDSYVDLDTGERCLTDGLPLRYAGYNANYQIFQTPGHVAILGEMFRDLRIIPLDGRPHTAIPQWLGDGRGHWDGDTLVVETRSFADKAHFWWVNAWRAARPNLRLVERFTRVDDETLEYEFSMEDPAMFTRPWTAVIPLTTNQASRGVLTGPLYEYACHEGNHGLRNTLAGARFEERTAAAQR